MAFTSSIRDDIINVIAYFITDKDIDFIARKSKEVNPSGTNATVLTDNKQLTQLVSQQSERNLDNFSAEIPRMVLPGGEIHDLPLLSPTPFYHGVTPHLHTHALHLQSNVKEMPVLSKIFKNVSVSNVVNVLKTETVLLGAGAYINPTSSSMSVFVPRYDAHFMENIPAVREMNVKNGVISEKISHKSENTNRQPLHNHDSLVNQIETSFKDISDSFENNFVITKEILQTRTTYTPEGSATSSESIQKVFTLLTDVFVIMGSSSGVTAKIEPTASITSSKYIDLQTLLNEFIEENVQVKKKPIHSSSSRFDHASKEFLPIVMATTKTLPSHGPFTEVRTGQNKSTTVETGNEHIKEIIPAENEMELNEIVVDVPVQEEIAPITENIQWINIFNEPQRTMEVHVGDILSSNGIILTNNSHSGEPLLGIDEMAIAPGSEIVPGIDTFNTKQRHAETNAIHSDLINQNIQNNVGNNVQLPPNDNFIHLDNLGAKDLDSNPEIIGGTNKDLPLPNVITRLRNKMQTNRDTYYQEISNNVNFVPPSTDTNVSWRQLQKHVKNIGTSNAITNRINTADIFPGNKENNANTNIQNLERNISFRNGRKRFDRPNISNTKALTTINHESASRIPQFNLRKSILNGKKALVVSRQNELSKGIHLQVSQNNRANANAQPWNFLNRIGINLASFGPNMGRPRIIKGITRIRLPNKRVRPSQSFANNGIVDRNVIMPNRQTGQIILRRGFQQERPSKTNRNLFRPYQQMNLKNRGMSKDFYS